MSPDMSVTLRQLCASDADFLYTIENLPDVSAQTGYVECVTRESVCAYLARHAAVSATPDSVRLVICVSGSPDDGNGRKQAGVVDLSDINHRDRYAEIGIAMLPEYRGMGVAAAALRLVERLACKMGLRNLTARVAAGNAAGLALFVQAGYDRAGSLPLFHAGAHGWEDVRIFCKRIG